MNSSAAAEGDLEDAAGDYAGICDQEQEPAVDVLRCKPRLRNRICLHHPADQVVGNVVAPTGCTIGVCTVVGQMTLTVMPSLATSKATDLASPMHSPFGGVVCRQLWNAHPAALST